MNVITSSSSFPRSIWAPVVKVCIGLGISVVEFALGGFRYRLRNFIEPTTSAALSNISDASNNSNSDGSFDPQLTGMQQKEHLLHESMSSVSAGFHVISIDESNAVDHRSGTGHLDAAANRDTTICRECIINFESHEEPSETPSVPSPRSWSSGLSEVHYGAR